MTKASLLIKELAAISPQLPNIVAGVIMQDARNCLLERLHGVPDAELPLRLQRIFELVPSSDGERPDDVLILDVQTALLEACKGLGIDLLV